MGRLFDEDCAVLPSFCPIVENRTFPEDFRFKSFEGLLGAESLSPFIRKLNDLRRGRGLGIGILELDIAVWGLDFSDNGVE